jgi:hypothetical protein
VLAQHFRALETCHVIGLHSTSLENTSRWAAVDVDWHGDTSTAPEVNFPAALHWYDVLCRLGFHPLLTDSNGKAVTTCSRCSARRSPRPEYSPLLNGSLEITPPAAYRRRQRHFPSKKGSGPAALEAGSGCPAGITPETTGPESGTQPGGSRALTPWPFC